MHLWKLKILFGDAFLQRKFTKISACGGLASSVAPKLSNSAVILVFVCYFAFQVIKSAYFCLITTKKTPPSY